MTVGQVASLASIVLSIGCIVIGLLLVSEDHIDPKVQGEAVRSFLCDAVQLPDVFLIIQIVQSLL